MKTIVELNVNGTDHEVAVRTPAPHSPMFSVTS